MRRLAVRHPGYGWADNKGYGTPEHLEALTLRGPTRHHRWSFEPVAQLVLVPLLGMPAGRHSDAVAARASRAAR
jgi:hypothetical protein